MNKFNFYLFTYDFSFFLGIFLDTLAFRPQIPPLFFKIDKSFHFVIQCNELILFEGLILKS